MRPPKVKTTPAGNEPNRTSARIEKGAALDEGRWSSEVADLSDDGTNGRNGFFVRKID
jgi:hypothetical protein